MSHLLMWVRAHWPHHHKPPTVDAFQVETMGWTTTTDPEETW